MNPISTFNDILSTVDTDSLSLTDYGRLSLSRLLKAYQYYVDIYQRSLDMILERCGLAPSEMTIVDFGGGPGILSMLAKCLGFARVIYVDHNQQAVDAMNALADKVGFRPDDVVVGDADALRDWCVANTVKPNALLGMDVIEHIYVIDDFVAAIHAISPSVRMVFTTSSTPYNSRVVRHLHKAMLLDENGTAKKMGFRQMRRDHIKAAYPDMSDRELDYWADNTRGLIYADVLRAVETQSPNLLLDQYNTCDPATGSWTERILPIDDYRHLLMPYGFSLTVMPGFYNEHRHGIKAVASRHYNKRIASGYYAHPEGMRQRRRYRKALSVAPFIYLIVNPES